MFIHNVDKVAAPSIKILTNKKIFSPFLVTPPAQRVQFILGEEGRLEPAHETHPVFSEMEELFVGEDGNMEWKETARYSTQFLFCPTNEV